MLRIAVIDNSAESRSRIANEMQSLLSQNDASFDFLPQISIKPATLQELKFQTAPDVCVVGEGLILSEPGEISNLRSMLPNAAILARIQDLGGRLSLVEQLVRLGADDVLSGELSAMGLAQKLIVLSRRSQHTHHGKLIIVDSAKGGTGVTSIAAGLAESLVERGKKVALLDLDFETQDLSRFLQARPFINENLQMIFDRQCPVTEESVMQCLVQVWQDAELYCMPPVGESEQLYDVRAGHARTLLSVLEVLDSQFDCVVADMAGARGALPATLYRAADALVMVVNNDPATLYASVDKVSRLKSGVAAVADLVLLENASSKNGLPSKLLHQEFNRAARIEEANWAESMVPVCREGGKWPGSGKTIFSQGSETLSRSFGTLLSRLGFGGEEASVRSRLGEWMLGLTAGTKKQAEVREALPSGRKLVALPGIEPAKAVQKQEPASEVEDDFEELVSRVKVA